MLAVKPGALAIQAHPPKDYLTSMSFTCVNIVIRCFEALLSEQQTLAHSTLTMAYFN